jgi:hypothetical protein
MERTGEKLPAMDDLQKSLAASPEVFPYSMDLGADRVSFVRLSRSNYQEASFLDARLLTAQTTAQPDAGWQAWPRVAAAVEAASLPEDCGFIFHIGHVGSTLLSRLMGAHRRVFALREPMILRTFAQIIADIGVRPGAWTQADYDVRLGGTLKLLSRTFDEHQTSIIKATSFVSELAAGLMSRAARPKAVMMVVSPESYMATILGGPNSRQETKILAPSRLSRLHRRIGRAAWNAASLSEGETVALSWACEMSALAQAADIAGDRVHRVDFDEFLLDPTSLRSVFTHFGIEATPAEVRAILDGPDMRRYSKAPEYAYDRALRLAVLNEARANHGVEIARGLAWLQRAAGEFSAVRQAMAFADRRAA